MRFKFFCLVWLWVCEHEDTTHVVVFKCELINLFDSSEMEIVEFGIDVRKYMKKIGKMA
jgi:hypothetical protein